MNELTILIYYLYLNKIFKKLIILYYTYPKTLNNCASTKQLNNK